MTVPGQGRQWLRWGINTLTGIGAALATTSLVFSFQRDFFLAWIMMFGAVVVDAVDGPLVRRWNLKPVLPQYDGDRLDEYADLVTFVVGPLGFAWASGLLPTNPEGLFIGSAVCVASLFQFSRRDAKSTRAFRGWPCYWNILFYYAWRFSLPSEWLMTITLVLCGAVFLPIYFVYPSRFQPLQRTTLTAGAIWGATILWDMLYPSPGLLVLSCSLIYPVYYLALSTYYQPRLRGDS